ncbi:MAG: choice-of-anchor C family protein [Pseudomonadota bacterium]
MLEKTGNPEFQSVENEDGQLEIIKLASDASDGLTFDAEDFLFSAEYTRDGHDLLITGKDGNAVLVEGYFTAKNPVDLVGPQGQTLRGDIVEVLAGPANPGVYAQQGNPEGASPIGQVEILSGNASVQRTDGSVEVLAIGTKVFQNDVVITEDGSSLSITFLDGTNFTLSDTSRMVLSELVFAPGADDNSAVFNLIEGTFVFVAGEVAKTGDMSVETPVATMGIRGTTVMVNIVTGSNGLATMTLTLNRDIDGTIGAITLTNNLDGSVTTITNVNSNWVINPSDGATQQVERSEAELAADLVVINQAFDAIEAANDRLDQGQELVDQDESEEGEPEEPEEEIEEEVEEETPEESEEDVPDDVPDDTPDDAPDDTPDDAPDDTPDDAPDDTPDDAPDDAPDDTPDDTPDDVPDDTPDDIPDNTPQDGTDNTQQDGTDQGSNQSNLGSGLDTASDVTTLEAITSLIETIEAIIDQPIETFASVDTTPDTTPTETDDPVIVEDPPLVLNLPEITGTVNEDGSISIAAVSDGGFGISGGSGGTISATLDANSSVSIPDGTGVTIHPDSQVATDENGNVLADRYDPLIITGTPAQILAALNGMIYYPDENQDSGGGFSILITDGVSIPVVATITIPINPSNDAPDASGGNVTGSENTIINATLPATDVDGDTLTFSIVNTPTNGTVTITDVNTGAYTYTPNADFDGSDTFTYQVDDGNGGTDTAIINLTIVGANNPPVATNSTATTDEDSSVNGTLSATDPESDPLTFSGTGNPADAPQNGNITLNPNGSFTYTPNANFNGNDAFTYQVSDGNGGTDTATVNITVNPVNDDPVANATNISGDEDSQIGDTLTATDPENDPLTFSGTGNPADAPQNGTVTLNPNGNFTYTPNANFNGNDAFTYQVSDGNGGTDTATVNITVNAVNDAPLANDDNISGDEDSQIGGTLTATDPENDPLTFSGTGNPADAPQNGNVTLNPNGSFTYTPNANFNGQDAFTYQVSDGNGGTDTATVNITVNPTNDDPVANGQNVAINEDFVLNGTLTATDLDGDALTFQGTGIPADAPQNGTVTLNPNGNFTYTPNANFNGNDAFTYQVSDGNGGTDTATVNINVNAINDAPVADGQNTSINEDSVLNGTLTATDPENDPLTFSATGNPADAPQNGNVTLNSNGSFTYTPNANFNGQDAFTYRVDDGKGGTDTATVNITVNAVNDDPVANRQNTSTNEDTVLNGVVTSNDLDGGPPTFTVTNNPSNGVVNLNPNTGAFTYTPNANFNGPDAFIYQVDDGNGGTDTATVNITVNAINDAPETTAGAGTGNEDAASITVNLSGSDVDGTIDNFRILTLPANGALFSDAALTAPIIANDLIPAATNSANVFFVPAANFSGTPSFTYASIDNSGLEDPTPATANITINAVNDPPVANGQNVTTNEDTVLNGVVTANDLDGGPPTFTVTNNPSNGVVNLNPNTGAFTYTPNANFNGPDAFIFQADDGNGGTDNATVNITINPVSDAPAGSDKTVTITEDSSHTLTESDFGFSDPNDNPADTFINIRITDLPANGSLTLAGANVAGNQVISVTQITAGDLVFTPDPDDNGPGYANFSFSVQDDGANGGQTEDQSPNTITFNVEPSNDAPVASPGDSVFDDFNDNVLDGTVWTTHLPSGANATNPAVTETGNELVLENRGYLVSAQEFEPTAETPVKIAGEWTFDDITEFLHITTRTVGSSSSIFGEVDDGVQISVAAVSIAGTNVPQGINAGEIVAGSFSSAATSAMPSGFTVGQTYRFEVVDDGTNITATFTQIGNAANTATVTTVSNFSGTSNFVAIYNREFAGGVDEHTSRIDNLTISQESVLNYTEGDPATAVAPRTQLSDVDDTNLEGATIQITGNYQNGQDILAFVDTATITGSFVAATGTLTLTGTDTVANYQAAIRSVTYNNTSASPNESQRTVEVIVNDGTTNSSASVTLINVESVSGAPAGTDKTITINEDAGHIFALADFGFTDPSDNPDDTFTGVRITTLPANGTLTVIGSGAVSAGDVIAAATIAGNNLVFAPTANENGLAYDSFTFQVQDNGSNGGATEDPTPNTITFNVDSISDAPEGADNTITINEDTPHTFSAADFGFSDPNDNPADTFTGIRIVGGSGSGTITLNGNPVAGGVVIPVASIPNLVYTPDADLNGNGITTYNFQVLDDGSDGGQNEDQSANTVTFNVNPVNDAPTVSGPVTANATEDGATVTINPLTNASDTEGDPLSIVNNQAALPAGVSILPLPGSVAPVAGVTLTDTTNITLANSQLETGGDATDNPNVVNAVVGSLIPYTETGVFNVGGGVFAGGNLDDGDIGVGIASDGTYAIAQQGSPAITLTFATSVSVGSIALYGGYGNRIDGNYTLLDGSNNVLGAWTISGIGGGTNDGVPSLWLTFDTPVLTNALVLNFTSTDTTTTTSFREIQVFGDDGPTTPTFTLDPTDASFQDLAAGATRDVTLTYDVSDGTDTTSTSATWTVTGINDAPTATAPSFGPELITNGGFENGPTAAFTLVSAGDSTTIPDWTVETGDVDHYTGAGFLTAPEGTNAVDLNGNNPGAISQTITTVVGETYLLTFTQSGDPLDGETVGDIRVNVAGTDTDFSFTEPVGATRPNPGSITHTHTFTATSNSTKITFTSLDTTDLNAGPHLDAVSVQEVPLSMNENSSLGLTGFSVADVDGDNVTVTITSNSGTLDLSSNTHVTAQTVVTGQGTGSLQISGPAAQVNLIVVNSLEYTPATNFNGTETISLQVDDGTAPAVSVQADVVVLPTNSVPIAVADTASVAAYTSTAALNDIDAIIVNDNHASALGTNATQTLTNNGGGVLTAAPATIVPDDRNNDVKLADLDGDGDLDAITSSFQVLINQGGTQGGTEGVFATTTVSTAVPGSAQGIAVGDIDGDGDIDVLTANWPFTANEIFTNDGSGTFTVSTLVGGANHSRDIALADVDGDGDLDAIVANNSETNQLLINQGGTQGGTEGAFVASNLGSLLNQANVTSLDIVFADVDGDGDLDALIANFEAGLGHNELLRNNGSGVFTPELLAGGTRGSSAIAAGDLDGDGDVDLIISNTAGEINQVLINDGAGNFTASEITGSAGSSSDVALADIDGDGDLDAVITNNGFGTTAEVNQLLINDGTGTFTVSTLAGGGNASNAIAFGDLDGDGSISALDANGLPRIGVSVFTGSVATNDSDPDSTNLTFTLDAPVDGLTLSADGSWEFDPTHSSYRFLTAGQTHNVVANYTVSDGALSAQSTLALTITGSNDAPIANDSSAAGNEDTLIVATPNATDDDNAQNTLTFAVATNPSNGIVVFNAGTGNFEYTPTANFNGNDSFTYTVNDGSLSDTATINITVNSVNDPPNLDLDADNNSGPVGNDYNTSFTEGGGAVAVGDVDVNITDPDDALLFEATITLTNRPDGVAESLSVSGVLPAGITVAGSGYESATGILVLQSGTGNSLSDFEQAIEMVVYNNTSNSPTVDNRIVNVVVYDGEDFSNTATTTISMNSVNQAPTVTVPNAPNPTTPAALVHYTFDAADTTATTIENVANPGTHEVTSVGFTSATGISNEAATFDVATNAADSGLVQDDLQVALGGNSFTLSFWTEGFHSGTPLGNFTANDGISSIRSGSIFMGGGGGIDQGIASTGFVNPGAGNYTHLTYVFNVNVGAGDDTLTTYQDGVLVATNPVIDNNGTGSQTDWAFLSGAGNDFAFGQRYIPGSSGLNPEPLVGTLDELRIFDSQLSAAEVSAVYAGDNGSFVTRQSTPLSITGISVADPDAGNADVTVTLAATNGSILVADSVANGLSATDIANNNSGSVTLTGTIAEINTTLAASNSVSYTPNDAFVGNDALTVTANDQGATGGGALTDAGTIDINVSPLNVITGTVNDDTLNGTAGNDLIDGLGPGTLGFLAEELFGNAGDDTLRGGNTGSEFFDGGDGDDTIIPGDSDPNNGDYINASLGNDRFNFSNITNGYVGVAYGNLTANMVSIIAAIDFASNTGTVQKFDNTGALTLIGTDEFVDINNAHQIGGMEIRGSQQADTFNITADPNGYIALMGGRGDDVFNLTSGFIRLEYRVEADGTNLFNRATQAADVNLSTGTAANDGFGGTDTINFIGNFASGSGNKIEIRGTDFADTLIGDNGDNRFIGEQGNDIINGMGGIDLIRFDRGGVASVEIDLSGTEATGYWDDTFFTYTISNLENIRGSNVGADILFGSTTGTNNGANEIDGKNGVDIINGLGGDDTLTGGGDYDVFLFDPNSGSDIITDFTVGEDLIVIPNSAGVSSTADFTTYNFDGSDTSIVLPDGSTLAVQGVNLVGQNPDDVFVFNRVNANVGTTTFAGTANNDFLVGTSGDDALNGGDGNDVIIANDATSGYAPDTGDLINAGAGDDLILAQAGFTEVIGGPGDDRIQSSRVVYVNDETSFSDSLFVDYSTSPAGIRANLTGSTDTIGGTVLNAGEVSDGFGGTDMLGGVSRVYDTNFDDFFKVDGSDPSVTGSRGEHISLSGGNDVVSFLSDGRVDFTRAEDGVRLDFTSTTTGGTFQAIDANLGNGDQIGNKTITGATQANGSNHDDIFIGDGNNNRFRGREGNDNIDGAGGNNTVDHFSATAGIIVDLSDGNAGGFILNNIANVHVEDDGQGGQDTLTNIQNVWGNLGADIIFGDANNNQLLGYHASDVLSGGDGNDTIIGDDGFRANLGAGEFAAGGDDTLAGGPGDDFLTGGLDGDVFVFNANEGFDVIEDLNFADGDRIDISSFGLPNINSIVFTPDAGNNLTLVDIDGGGDEFSVEGIGDLQASLTAAELDELFILDVIEGNAGSSDSLGTSGAAFDDYYRPLEGDPLTVFDEVIGSDGNDTIDFSFNIRTFQSVNYNGLANAITFSVNAGTNTATTDKGVLGTDTFRNIINPLNSGFFGDGGFGIRGTSHDDTFVINNFEETWMLIRAGDGADNYDFQSDGAVRLDLRGGTVGVNIDLDDLDGNGFEIDEDGFSNMENILNPQNLWEIRGTGFNDYLLGSSSSSNSFITDGGDNTVDGRSSEGNRIRFDRSGVTELDVDLQTGVITSKWSGVLSTDSVSNIQWVRGSNDTVNGDVIRGTTGAEQFQGRNGDDTLLGRGGADTLEGNNGSDTIQVPDIAFTKADGGSGLDTLEIIGGGQVLDFTGLGTDEINSIETLDLGTGDGLTQVTLNDQNIINFSETFDPDVNTPDTDPGPGTTGTALALSTEAILVRGDSSDTLNLGDSGTHAGASWQLPQNDDGFNVYNFSNGGTTFASVVVEDDVNVAIV